MQDYTENRNSRCSPTVSDDPGLPSASVVLLFKLSDESKRYPVRQPDILKKSPNRLNLHACP